MRASLIFARILLWALCLSSTAAAITAKVEPLPAATIGVPIQFTASAGELAGQAQTFRWTFGDGERIEDAAGLTSVEHTYAAPGIYTVHVLVRDLDAEGVSLGYAADTFQLVVHYPLLPAAPRATTDIIYDAARTRVYNVNPDNDTVSAVDAATLTKLAELPVYGRPEALAIAPNGKLWVVHRDDYAVAIVDLDTFTIERGFRLPYASQPIGLVMSPSDDAAYITLMAVGKVLKLDTRTAEVLGEVEVGSWARGIAISHDGLKAYVTRFITTGERGEVVLVDTPTMQVSGRWGLEHDPGLVAPVTDEGAPTTDEGDPMMEGLDTDRAGRGLPNYLFSVALSPDGRQAWIPAKKDNIRRGLKRDGLALNEENTVRPMVAAIDVATGTEPPGRRMDVDDRNLPTHVTFSPQGHMAFVTLTGSDNVEVRNAYKTHTEGNIVTALAGAGKAPRGTVLGPDGRLFVHGSLSRSVVVFDVSSILLGGDLTHRLLAEIPVVTTEKLAPDVLLGKQIFYASEDKHMSQEGYISCATCHFDGFEDGRVWDFTSRGEGFRNTVSLLGRRGTGHGPVHWSANFDEIQDFEHDIRGLFSGTGFLDDALFTMGTRNTTLGDRKAGLSPSLDALAAYVTSLDQMNRSPFRNPDGSFTSDAVAGQAVFQQLGCQFCHAGEDFTDSAQGMLHDVGTLSESSGSRLNGPLTGLDTPTLLGLWETAPYLHDGSAATLLDVLTTKNPEDAHGFTSSLTDAERSQLVRYLLELDGNPAPGPLPFEPTLPEPSGPDVTMDPVTEPAPAGKGCACELAASPNGSSAPGLVLLGALLWLRGFRRRRSMSIAVIWR